MRIAKIHIPTEVTKSKNLDEIKLITKNLGPLVALVGRNGAGKSRILHFVENYFNTITADSLASSYIDFMPEIIIGNNSQALSAANNSMKAANKYEGTNIASYNVYIQQATQQIKPIYSNLKKYGKAYIKVIDNDALKIIKENVDKGKSMSFEEILNNQHFQKLQQNQNPELSFINEFNEFNSLGTIEYITKLTQDIIADEFNLYIKNRNSPEVISKEMEKKISYQLFSKFQYYVNQFLGNEFSYQQSSSGNTFATKLHYNNQPFNLNLFSPGQKTLFAYAIFFFFLDVNSKTNLKESILIIDEPEKHLHPDAQIKLIKALKEIVSEKGQLWIATHSVHILCHLDHDEIILVKDSSIIAPSRTTPGNSFIDLMGLEQHIYQLKTFITSISEWAYGNFMLQCFKEPEVIFSNNPNDPQFTIFKKFLMNNQMKVNLLDFGAGKGRIGYTIKEDSEVSKKINYSAFEPAEANYALLNNVPNIKKVYKLSEEIPDNSFECVLLCNVLHEINPNQWESILLNIKRVLTDNGFLIVIEDLHLPKGENANEFGYLLLNNNELKTLMDTDSFLQLELEAPQYKDRILFNVFTSDEINPTNNSVHLSIQQMHERIFEDLKKFRHQQNDVNDGRKYANATQLYINSKLALESFK